MLVLRMKTQPKVAEIQIASRFERAALGRAALGPSYVTARHVAQ
jgi:hypothetical protein